MLSFLGFLTIFTFLALIMTRRLSVHVALILIPAIAAIVGSYVTGLYAPTAIGKMMIDGILKVAPVGVMIAFAILYFGLMLDVGLFDPLINRLVRLLKGDPVRVCVGAYVLTVLVALDGDGATTFMIACSAMVPIFRRLNMRMLALSGCVCLGAGSMNIIPWGGPTARAMASLHVTSDQLFTPVLIPMIIGVLFGCFCAYLIGRKERSRLHTNGLVSLEGLNLEVQLSPEDKLLRKPGLFWANLILTVIVIVFLIRTWLPLAVIFMAGVAIALPLNYRHVKDQQERINAWAQNMAFVASMIFAAGIFTGVLTGTKMIQAMSQTMVSLIPDALSSFIPIIVAVTSMPLSLVLTPDAYYFGVLPIISQTAQAFGIEPAIIGRAAILGQMTTGFPLSPLTASTFILIGLCGVELGEHQKFIFWWSFSVTIVMTIACLILGVLPFPKF
ncbi:MAG: citrate:proton symporter [Syntrophales bacterium]|nr:citrate:proton symporter [Syntrophales bacterium]